MTRWAITVDLSRCVGCQTCTSSCKHANATAPGVQWRKVLDFEVGSFPDVARAFVPVGCMHCEEPSCLEVCPSTATRKRDDGIVTIDYDICIGCSYCIVACPYQARYRVDAPEPAYGRGRQMRHEAVRDDQKRLGVAQKCTLCADRIDSGLAAGLVPGLDEAATPACVASCISGALQMGDLDDPESNVSQLLREHAHSRMHEDLGNGPGIYYLHERAGPDAAPAGPPPMAEDPPGLAAVSPRLQTQWDWRAAMNFILGGSGTGLFAANMLAGPSSWWIALLALAMVGIGLAHVWAEIGKPWRFLNVYRHPQMSWMTREAMIALPFFALGGMGWLMGVAGLGPARLAGVAAALFALGFLYAQGRILRAAKGIPLWRRPEIVALIVATGLAEGAGLLAALLVALEWAVPGWLPGALVLLLGLRFAAWRRYRTHIRRDGAPTKAIAALNACPALTFAPQAALAALALAALLPLWAPIGELALFLAGLGAAASGWAFKFNLITRAAFDQGYALNRMPARGAGKSRAGLQPGWTRA